MIKLIKNNGKDEMAKGCSLTDYCKYVDNSICAIKDYCTYDYAGGCNYDYCSTDNA